jgi:hypothetical protein
VVLLAENANDATVYEEYLHVLEGQARGWVGVGFPESAVEEVVVERRVLENAGELGMTFAEQMELQQNIQGYLTGLAKHAPDVLGDFFGLDPNDFLP